MNEVDTAEFQRAHDAETADDIAPLLVCDRCGNHMREWNCKIVCPNCGGQFDCSDLNLYFD
jgi:hypothetical protein